MKDNRNLLITLGLLVGMAVMAPASAGDDARKEYGALFGTIALPKPAAVSSASAMLGRALFWDTRASANGQIACASCHTAADWSADRRRFPLDARNKPTTRHSQPVFNAMLQSGLRWTADRPGGAAQAEGSLTGSMGFADKATAVARLKALGYEPAFRSAFPGDPDPVTAANYAKAIEAYERTLVTPAPFDRFLAGDDDALDARQKAGMRAFVASGCAGCHNGALLGGQQLQKFGLVRDYWLETGSDPVDQGLFMATKNESDKYFFRVAPLRNIARTAPYFHDGSVARLEDAIRIMASVQLGRAMTETEVTNIAAFLHALTGPVPDHYAPPAQMP